MTRPSSGVKPMEVSTDLPPRIAVTEAPLPRWAITPSNSSDRKVQQRRGPVRDVFVRGAVEAVAADAVVGVELVRHGVAPGVLGQGAVEGGVEHGHLRHLRPLLGDGADAQHVGGVVQRGQRVEPLDGAGDLVVDQHGLAEPLAAVDHAVPHGVQLPVTQHLVDGGVHQLEGLGMVRAGPPFRRRPGLRWTCRSSRSAPP